MRAIFSLILLLSLFYIVGCSGNSGSPKPMTSQDELQNFLEANPELNVPDNAQEEDDDDE